MHKLLLLLLAFVVTKLPAQCDLQLLNCNTAIQSCDLSANNAGYWNSIFWWDNPNQTHDLAETEVDLNVSVLDPCPGPGLQVRCLLFLDLNGDGIQETVLDSDNPPPAGGLYYDNAFNPNYTGGVLRSFDERPVSDNQKWRFVLQNTVSGDTSNLALKWAYDAAPGVFALPELAHGTHKVRWSITNASGQTVTCEKTFTVKDCKAPTVVCLNGLSVNIMPTQMITLWATDFLQYSEDNVTPTGLINIGIRKQGTGSGFPVDANGSPVTSVTFACSELGTQLVELWAQDVAGNADFCQTYVVVQDNLGICSNEPGGLTSCATLVCGIGGSIGETNFKFDVSAPNLPPFSLFEIGGCASLNQPLPANSVVTITPSNDADPLNGVSTYDLVLIDQFIHGVNQFSNPYQWIAADANNDKVIDTFDIIECKKLILGIYSQLPNNSSWRFVVKSYVLPLPNPLSAPFPESITFNINDPAINTDFVGVKICDVNCTSIVGFFDLQPENEHLIGIPSPNPTDAGAMLPIQLVGNERVLLELLDFSGRLIFRTEMTLPEGPAMMEIPASAMDQAGVYVWRVRAGEVAKTGKLVRY